MPSFTPNKIDITLLDLALQEDLGYPFTDATSDPLLESNKTLCRATIISKENHDSILCGLPIIKHLSNKIDSNIIIHSENKDGDIINPHQLICTLQGKAQSILRVERTLLNFLRHLSAISTLTHQFVTAVSHTHLKILDTRKTTPGMRHMEKYAVQCGGGVNHRMGLYDCIMIKDTHIDFLGSIDQTLNKLRNPWKLPVIVEVRNLNELQTVLDNHLHKVTRILFDNMSIDQLQQSITLCQNRIETECSGNISLKNIVEIANTGVNYASIGSLTYNAGQVDYSMKIST